MTTRFIGTHARTHTCVASAIRVQRVDLIQRHGERRSFHLVVVEHVDQLLSRGGGEALNHRDVLGTILRSNVLARCSLCTRSLACFYACCCSSWMYVANAYGAQSRELAVAMLRDWKFGPMDRFKHDSDEGRQAFEAYLHCLLRWNFVKYERRGGKGTKKLTPLPESQHLPANAKPLSAAHCNAIFHS